MIDFLSDYGFLFGAFLAVLIMAFLEWRYFRMSKNERRRVAIKHHFYYFSMLTYILVIATYAASMYNFQLCS